MLASKNRLMFILSLFMIILSIAVHLLHRVFDIFGHSMNGHGAMSAGGGAEQFTLIVNILLIVPVALLAAGLVLYGKRKEHPWIPMLNTMALTFSSISMIAGGGGMVELHFSIFMVVAMLSYYEQIKLVVAMSSVFALQHAIGFFVLPEVVFGVSEYSLLMMSIHALFLVLTSTAVIRQIASKRDITAALEKEKAIKQGEIDRLLVTVKELSGELDSASVVVADQSASNIASGDEMLLAFKEVALGLEAQSESVNGIEMNLQSMNGMIRNSVHAFKELNEKAAEAEQLVRSNQNYVEPLFEQISIVSEAIQRSSQAMQSLDHSTRHVESIISTIREVASQTQLLALNASIEAAHAGHHGTGFAVVASEIRKLADRSNAATGQISQILTGIQSESAASAAQIELGKEAAAYTVELAHTTVDSYRLMNEGIKEMVDIAASLSDAVEELDRRAKEISIEMMNITAVTEQGVASVEEMYSTTEAQLNATHHINGEITKLKELATTLSRQFMQS